MSYTWFSHLEKSHLALSRNDVEAAKKEALLACLAINEALKTLTSPSKEEAKAFRQYGDFVLNHYKTVCSKGSNALLAKEKLDWLTSNINGFWWYPEMQMGQRTSFDILPIPDLSQPDEKIRLPELGPDFSLEFRPIPLQKDVCALLRNLQLGSDSALDLYQDLLSNCSFVLALISIDHLGLSRELYSAIAHLHSLSSCVKVRLFIHGIRREVVVSKTLPYVKSTQYKSRSLFVRSISNPDLLWPALMEKAFLLTLEGQYDFLGSNMANDTYMLIGWLPEIRMVSKTNFDSLVDLCKLSKSGIVSLGLGTGSISAELSKNLGLVSQHDYVLDGFDESKGTFTIINPWMTPEADVKANSSRYIKLDYSLLSQFNYLYLNWKPNYKSQYQTSFVCASSPWPAKYLGDKAQFSFSNPLSQSQTIAILVEQFITLRRDFSVSVWKGARDKMICTSQYLLVSGGKYTNSRLQFLELTMDPGEAYIVSVSPCAFPKDQKTSSYSLSVYHNLGPDFAIGKSTFKLNQRIPQVTGSWALESMGGNWSYETFLNNPQYDVEVFEGTRNINLILGCNNDNINVNFHMFHFGEEDVGHRIRRFDELKLLFNQNYTKQLQFMEVNDINPGHYKLVLSTFDPNVSADYKLLIGNDGKQAVKIQVIPEALGLFMRKEACHWDNSNREKFLLSTKHPHNKLLFQIFSGGGNNPNDYRPALRASVFDAFTRKPVVITTQWNDCVYGIYLECVLEFADREYILLVQRFEQGTGPFRINIGSSSKLEFLKYTE